MGTVPLANAYVPNQRPRRRETFYPLQAYVCAECRLVQLSQSETPQALFGEYAYFSGYSETWSRHCADYAEQMTAELGLDCDSLVVELASNDGCLLQCFQQRGVPVLGVEPAANVAAAAQEKGVPTEIDFFSVETARRLAGRGVRADLLVANNVLAHVPDICDFVAGMKILLAAQGTITVEFPHLLRLMQANQFDTIYHEHIFYLSLEVVQRIFAAGGLCITHVEELSTHGGSLRVFAQHAESSPAVDRSVERVLESEQVFGLHQLETYCDFGARMRETKRHLLDFLHDARRDGKRVAGYGAPAKATTLLNFCCIDADLLELTVDRNPHKQGHDIPGTHIPILDPTAIDERRPDYVLILPWNLQDEITAQLAGIRSWGGQFVLPTPEVSVLP